MAIWIAFAVVIGLVMFYLTKISLLVHALGETFDSWRYSSTSIIPGDASLVPEVDHEDLQRQTAELEQVGFVIIGDVVSTQELGTNPQRPKRVETRSRGLGRIFAHPEHGCYANLISVLSVSTVTDGTPVPPSSTLTPFKMSITTLSGTGDEDWIYTTGNRATVALNLIYRHPRHLVRSLVKAGAGELLEVHLRERVEIAERAGVTWDLAPDFTKYQEYEATVMGNIKRVNDAARPSEVAWIMLTFPLRKHDLWMGELGGKVKP